MSLESKEKENSSLKSRKAKIRAILDDVQSELMRACFKIFETPYLIVSIFLFVFIMISSGLAGYLVIQTILSYLSYEVTTTTRTMFESSSEFPKITICNCNPFTSKNSVEFLKRINNETRPEIDMFDENQVNQLNFTAKSEFFQDIYDAANVAMLSLSDDEKKMLSHNLEDILISCQFNGESCNTSDFTWKFDKFFGNCYIFNSGLKNESVDVKKSHIAGSLFGLNVMFYANFYENLTLLNSLNYKGAYVRIENSSLLYDDLLDNGIYISTGKWSSALIHRILNYILPKPYSTCELDNESGLKNVDTYLLRLFYHSPYQYTQQSCIIQCLQYFSLKECNCTYPLYLSLFGPNEEHCITDEQYECYSKIWNNFLRKNYVQEHCVPLCPLECNRTIFAYQVTETELMGDLLANYINEKKNLKSDFITKTVDSETARKSVVRLSLFSDSLSYSLSTEAPKMDLISLFANIGGNLGLFLNIGFFSFGEIFVICFEIFYVFKKERKKKEHCVPLCPLECNRTIFAYQVTETELMGGILANYINENANLKEDFMKLPIDSEMARKSIVRFSIFTDTLSYSLSTEMPRMDLISMLASIGGNLGLFLNLGFFSFGEIFVILIEIFYVFKSEKRKVQPKLAWY